MKRFSTALMVAAGLAAFTAQAGADDTRLPASLTAFGAAPSMLEPVKAAGLALDPAATASQDMFATDADILPVAYGKASIAPSYAASVALDAHVALDSGYNLDLTRRFDNNGEPTSPLMDRAGLLGLANGGHYGGITYVPSPSLRLRLGVQTRDNQRDGQGFAPALGLGGMPLNFGAGQQQSLLAGASWDVTSWAGLDVSGIANQQKGQPAGLTSFAALGPNTNSSTQGVNVSAHVNFGSGWETRVSFSQGLTQLDQKTATPAVDTHSYSIAIAKHGVFGADALGFSFSRPADDLADNGPEMIAANGDLPPVFINASRMPGAAPETDLQLGYVSYFENGALALQANAAYQMNYQGQTGATSLAVLSRAKIKF